MTHELRFRQIQSPYPQPSSHFVQTKYQKIARLLILVNFFGGTATPTIVIKIRPGWPWLLQSFLDLEKDMEPFLKMSFLINYRNPVDTMKSSLK